MIIDEFPFIVSKFPEVPSVFQDRWDSVLKNSRIMLVLTGSSVGMMEKHALSKRSPLFGRRTVLLSILQGLSVLAIALTVFAISRSLGHGENEARALTFTTLVVANLALIFTNRSWSRTIVHTLRSPNAALWWSALGTIAFLGLVLYVPFLKVFFRFSTLHAGDLAICLAAGAVSVGWFEALKAIGGRRGWALTGKRVRS